MGQGHVLMNAPISHPTVTPGATVGNMCGMQLWMVVEEITLSVLCGHGQLDFDRCCHSHCIMDIVGL